RAKAREMLVACAGAVEADDTWLREFHAGRRSVLGELYREHFATVEAAVGRILIGADKETVIHEVFFKLISSSEDRQRFQGGSFGAWIATVARNLAVGPARGARREKVLPTEEVGARADADAAGLRDTFEDRAAARILVERFRT